MTFDIQHPTICFDDDYRVRVLDNEKSAHTQELDHECNQFVTKIEEFNETVKGVLELMEGMAKRIELEKMRAIGQRNRVDNEIDNRSRYKIALQTSLKEKMIELERYNQQYQSLAKVETEQLALIERLSNNEA